MEDIINLIATDASPAEISGSIKNALYAKTSEMINAARPEIASLMFDENETSEDNYSEEEE